MTAPQFAPTDDETHDLLALVADVTHPVGRDAVTAFLAACRRDAMAHDGLVSVNRVRELLAGEQIPARRYSALWSHFTGKDRPMVMATRDLPDGRTEARWETCEGSTSGNDGKPFRLRRWVGVTNP